MKTLSTTDQVIVDAILYKICKARCFKQCVAYFDPHGTQCCTLYAPSPEEGRDVIEDSTVHLRAQLLNDKWELVEMTQPYKNLKHCGLSRDDKAALLDIIVRW